MNAKIQQTLSLLLLAGALLLLPACGSNNAVKTQKPPATVLNDEATPVSSGTADIGMANGEDTSVNTYVEDAAPARKKSSRKVSEPIAEETPAPAVAATTPDQTPAVEAAAPVKKKGRSWMLWLLAIPVLAGAGWYFWSKNQPMDHPSQPMPPVGGLSPVSGFTGSKGSIEDTTEAEESIWTKKLF